MEIKRVILLFSFMFLMFCDILYSQKHVKDSVVSTFMVEVSGGVNFPLADFAQRFGVTYNIGGGLTGKTRKNIMYGMDFHFNFGNNIKNVNGIFEGLLNEQGQIISDQGVPADVDVTLSGWNVKANAGKLFPWFGPNPNSGVVITGGIGWMWYKYRIRTFQTSVSQLTGDYKKGYDQLTGGFMLNETIGYLYMGNSRVLNFFLGVEFMQAFTKGYRPYNTAQMQKDNKARFDATINIKFAWFIPIYKRDPSTRYYY